MSDVIVTGQDEALLSSNPITRITARATASRWVGSFQEWLNSEVARGEDPANIILAMIRVHIMTHSSVVANFMGPKGFQEVADGYKMLIDASYVRHANECAVAIAQERASQ